MIGLGEGGPPTSPRRFVTSVSGVETLAPIGQQSFVGGGDAGGGESGEGMSPTRPHRAAPLARSSRISRCGAVLKVLRSRCRGWVATAPANPSPGQQSDSPRRPHTVVCRPSCAPSSKPRSLQTVTDTPLSTHCRPPSTTHHRPHTVTHTPSPTHRRPYAVAHTPSPTRRRPRTVALTPSITGKSMC